MVATIRTSLAVSLLAVVAGAQAFDENFDSYPVGALEGNTHASGAAWKGWGGTFAVASLVSPTYSVSAPHSAEIVFGCDTVFEFDDMTAGNPYVSGRWELTAELYIPGAFTGKIVAMKGRPGGGGRSPRPGASPCG